MMRQSIAALISLVQFISLLLVLTPPSFATSSNITFEMIPNSQDRFVKEGTTLNITCRCIETNFMRTRSIDDYRIEWTLPRIFNEKTMPINKTSQHHDRQMTTVGPPFNLTITSTLTVYNATSKETGSYRCYLFTNTNHQFEQHIYINDGKSLVTIPTYKTNQTVLEMEEASNVSTVERMEVDEGSDANIPCRATQPNVTISYSYRTFASANPISLENHFANQNAQNLFRDIPPSSMGQYSSWGTTHLALGKVGPSDSGIYKCRGSDGTKTSEIDVLLIVKGIDFAMAGGYREVEEGSNVTLVCTIYSSFDTRSLPVWRSGTRYGKLKSNLPLGINALSCHFDAETTLKWPKDLQFHAKISYGYVLNEFYRSRLQLFNVRSRQIDNNYFDCCTNCESEVNRIRDREIAIRFKSADKDVEIVDIETGRETTLTCANKRNLNFLDYPNIQWFKDDELVNMTGNQHVIDDEYMKGNQLTLNGDPANDGRYQCTYEDKYGDERRRIFIVKTNNQLNVNESIRSKNGKANDVIGNVAITVIAVGLWWLFHNSVCNHN